MKKFLHWLAAHVIVFYEFTNLFAKQGFSKIESTTILPLAPVAARDVGMAPLPLRQKNYICYNIP
jgi:hypothetical protein